MIDQIELKIVFKSVVVFVLCLFSTFTAIGQTDTTKVGPEKARVVNAAKDTLLIEGVNPHSPRRATMLAAILPSAGQIYNKKYWKVPLVYVGFGIIGYFIYDNNRTYQNFLQAWTAKYNGGSNDGPFILAKFYPELSAQQLERLNDVTVLKRNKDLFRRYLELSILSAAAFYALQIIDANVDAHLKGFDWNNHSISLRFEPIIENNYAGLGFRLRW
ncbi:DUF5683 domain-containing protein [Cytophagaceae bacterium DM2B3-1]|uniref:DUF5683 domain-containing protein n=1 Tax=Xanthocytophaga flava TaxID=3048013 RepID=A0ABT7CES5_9BACT|nr:DUF5683 domain-containing protein [Xanthocytophaga flavus]MDJ1470570.1 DUF5683 domain-containing protein [Xanthocytophaga flavus]MDJ1491587.1 DUF5683 domain-containing protein [Xanthocytophaga flavus]